jgi:tripartite ATP-independent transporter DctM subunit
MDALIAMLPMVLIMLLLMMNMPVGFALGAAGTAIILFIGGPDALYMLASTAWTGWGDFLLVAIPLFVIMAAFLEGSGVADDLYEAIYKWMGPIKGGLGMGTIFICTIFAAMSGTSALGTLSMGVIALPSMMKRKYDKKMVIGAIAAGGTMGILIPPSLGMIFFGYLAKVSIGKLFIAGIIPGLILSAMFIAYIGIKCYRNPEMGPPVPVEERFTLKQKLIVLKSVILPVLLILIVLGLIYSGVATPTEAAGVGAFGAFLCVIIYKKFSFSLMQKALLATLRITAMVGFLILGAKLFTQALAFCGSTEFVVDTINNFGVNRWVILIGTQLIVLFLGCFIDGLGIMIITIPIFMPLITSLGFDPVWFGILFTINMEMAYLTPPFGLNLFYMKMICSDDVTMGEIFKSVVPYILIMAILMIIVAFFPQLALWLPNMMQS